MGSADCVAPEVITANSYDYRCDLWSVGSVLFTCLYGESAFGAESDAIVLKKVARASGPRLGFSTVEWKLCLVRRHLA